MLCTSSCVLHSSPATRRLTLPIDQHDHHRSSVALNIPVTPCYCVPAVGSKEEAKNVPQDDDREDFTSAIPEDPMLGE